MKVSRRSLRKGLVAFGCLISHVSIGSSLFGLALIVVGGFLHWLSKAYLEQNRDLTTAGPYRWTRNPFYLANLLIDAGIVCVIGQLWLGLAYAILWAVAYDETIKGEEAHLRELFGARFDDYASRVPRLFPFRAPLDPALARGRFDLANPSLLEGREYARLLGIALAPGAIWAADALRHLRFDVFSDAHSLELGAILFVPALWILKLGLAETLRRPETRLLPQAGPQPARLIGNLAVSGPLAVAVYRAGGVLGALAAVALLGGAMALADSGVSRRVRLFVGLGVILLALALGAMNQVLWLAVAPALWFSLAAVDDIGQLRLLRRSSATLPEQNRWHVFGRVWSGVVLAMIAIEVGRSWARRGLETFQ